MSRKGQRNEARFITAEQVHSDCVLQPAVFAGYGGFPVPGMDPDHSG